MTTVIDCQGATRRYESPGGSSIVAVADVDLEVRAGEFVAVVGPSGSGKTTLLGLLAGLERADAGIICVLGHDLARLSATERARLRRSRLGIVFQTFGLIASLRAGENVALPLALDGLGEAERRSRASDALDEVGLGNAYDARIDELSGGERQRVGVARAMSMPSRSTRPAVGRSTAATRLRSVLFPDPDRPIIATNSPAGTSRSTPRNAIVSISLSR